MFCRGLCSGPANQPSGQRQAKWHNPRTCGRGTPRQSRRFASLNLINKKFRVGAEKRDWQCCKSASSLEDCAGRSSLLFPSKCRSRSTLQAGEADAFGSCIFSAVILNGMVRGSLWYPHPYSAYGTIFPQPIRVELAHIWE